MSEIRVTLIRDHIAALWNSFGGQHLSVDEVLLRELHAKKDYTGMFGVVKKQMLLSLRLQVGFVNKGGPRHAPAWVDLRLSGPLYGTEEYKRTIFTVFIKKAFLAEAPFESVVYAIAHELAHVLLASLGNTLCVVEEAVDLTVLLLGYGKFYAQGREYPSSSVHNRNKEEEDGGLFVNILKPLSNFLESIGAKKKKTPWVGKLALGYLSPDEIRFAETLICERRRP